MDCAAALLSASAVVKYKQHRTGIAASAIDISFDKTVCWQKAQEVLTMGVGICGNGDIWE
jgi:hypothetical protein